MRPAAGRECNTANNVQQVFSNVEHKDEIYHSMCVNKARNS